MSSRAGDNVSVLRSRAADGFQQRFGYSPTLFVAAPGRVNLIGEHTDYNDGYVLPAAINRHVVMAASRRSDRRVRLWAVDLNQETEFDLDDIQFSDDASWSNYQRGVAWALQEAGFVLSGVDAVLTSDVPIGSGLSSSAAVEVSMAFTFQLLSKLDLDGVQRAVLCQRAEGEFVGMRCGIMDQYIISLGRRGHALMIDCRSLDYQTVPVPPGCAIVIADTNKRRGLVDSEYNTRRQECETGAAILGVKALRDVSSELFARHVHELDAVTAKRCRHIVTEDERVVDAVASLQRGDVEHFGELMNASHISLRDDYEVSCAELDAMVAAAWKLDGVYGARMTGAGFGGCTVNLVKQSAAQVFARDLAAAYQAATGLEPEIYICTAEEGVHAID